MRLIQFSNVAINRLFLFLFLRDVSVDNESEKTMKLPGSLLVMMSKAKSMTIASTLKIQDLSGRQFLNITFSITVQHPTLSMFFEYVVYMHL